MREFKSWRDYRSFENAVKKHTRYVRNAHADEFLSIVLKTAKKRIDYIPAKGLVWRAQRGHALEAVPLKNDDVYERPVPFPAERMKPPRDRAQEGRANPKGIPCLYVSTDRETALAEVRPWVGSLVSAWQFRTRRKLRVVNCTIHGADRRVIYVGKEPSPKIREECVWVDIDKAFAEPVTREGDDIADYAPTQLVAEYFKIHGFDGIAYGSSLGSGHNIALFDLNAADPITPYLFEAEAVKFEFKEV